MQIDVWELAIVALVSATVVFCVLGSAFMAIEKLLAELRKRRKQGKRGWRKII